MDHLKTAATVSGTIYTHTEMTVQAWWPFKAIASVLKVNTRSFLAERKYCIIHPAYFGGELTVRRSF